MFNICPECFYCSLKINLNFQSKITTYKQLYFIFLLFIWKKKAWKITLPFQQEKLKNGMPWHKVVTCLLTSVINLMRTDYSKVPGLCVLFWKDSFMKINFLKGSFFLTFNLVKSPFLYILNFMKSSFFWYQILWNVHFSKTEFCEMLEKKFNFPPGRPLVLLILDKIFLNSFYTFTVFKVFYGEGTNWTIKIIIIKKKLHHHHQEQLMSCW